MRTLATAALMLILIARAAESTPALSVLHAFSGAEGSDPNGLLLQGPNGVLYGATLGGNGTVFSLAQPATGQTAWTLTTLFVFSGADANAPLGGLAMDSAGNLFGAAQNGGLHGDGAVFELMPPAAGGSGWTERTIWQFGGPKNGQNPSGRLSLLPDGSLVGVTGFGGAGLGTVYRLVPPADPAGPWTQQLIWTFKNEAGGCRPLDVRPGAGSVLFGTTAQCGANANGTVFSLTPSADAPTGWTGATLYSFPQGDARDTASGLAIGAAGALYGTTVTGAADGGATVFQLAPPIAGGAWTYTTIAKLPADTEFTVGGVAVTPSGRIIGAGGELANGEVFGLVPPASGGTAWHRRRLAVFTGANGSRPQATPILGLDGAIYGSTEAGGTGAGVIWRLAPERSADR